jgi:hypothetical protein
MVKLFRKVKYSIRWQFNKVFHKATKNFNNEVEDLVNKTLASEEIEEIVVRAIERVIFSLVRRYWLVFVILLLVLLGIQSIFLSITIAALLGK